MTQKFRIIPVIPSTSSVILLNGNMLELDKKEQGLETEIAKMFSMINMVKEPNKIREVLAHVTFKRAVGDESSSFSSLFMAKPFLLLESSGNFPSKYNSKVKEVCDQVFKTLCLITWARMDSHFTDWGIFKRRSCIVCGKKQDGEHGGYYNMSGNEIIFPISNLCLNRECFSHEMGKVIYPGYEFPEEVAQDEEKRLSKEKLAIDEIGEKLGRLSSIVKVKP